MRFIISLLLSISCTVFAGQQELSVPEKQIVEYLAATQSEQVVLLEALVNTNSGTENIEGVLEVGELLIPKFEALGFSARWEAYTTDPSKAPTLIFERTGTQGERLLLIGHLDTVFSADSPFQDFTHQENMASGPGVTDMKGGLVVILYALKALEQVDALDNTTIRVVLTGDEENAGRPASVSRAPLITAAKSSDIALDFESSNGLEKLSIARRGSSHWLLTANSDGGHSSLIFQEGMGAGAIYELVRILEKIRLEVEKDDYLTFNPGSILGGTKLDYEPADFTGSASGKRNVIAGTAMAQGDMRYINSEQRDAAIEKIKAIVAKHLPNTQASIEFQESLAPMPPTKNSEELLNKYSAISEGLGFGKVNQQDIRKRGGGDISYVAAFVPTGLVGLGIVGCNEHTVEEIADLSSLVPQSQRAALLIYELTSLK